MYIQGPLRALCMQVAAVLLELRAVVRVTVSQHLALAEGFGPDILAILQLRCGTEVLSVP